MRIFFLVFFLFTAVIPANAAEMCITLESDTDAALIDFTDELGWKESLGISRRAFAKDKLMAWIVGVISARRAALRKNVELNRIEDEERRRAATELGPIVRITEDEGN